eukprot:2684746-Pleurochrysis_carterae.AAC.2
MQYARKGKSGFDSSSPCASFPYHPELSAALTCSFPGLRQPCRSLSQPLPSLPSLLPRFGATHPRRRPPLRPAASAARVRPFCSRRPRPSRASLQTARRRRADDRSQPVSRRGLTDCAKRGTVTGGRPGVCTHDRRAHAQSGINPAATHATARAPPHAGKSRARSLPLWSWRRQQC